MGLRMNRKVRTGLTLGIAGAVAFGAYAFTASNTVPASKAGDGSGAISGYTVSGIAYTLNATNAANLDAVDFTLDGAAGTVKIQLNGTDWYDCAETPNAGNTDVSCDTTSPHATVVAANDLRVIAVS